MMGMGHKVDNDHEAIRGWTQAEKYNLIQALKAGGLNNMELIQESVPTRTAEELKAGLAYYKSVALQHPLLTALEEKKKPKKKSSNRRKANGPILQWQQQLANALEPDQLRTETATAVRMLAEAEDIPAKELTGNIDFRKVYHQIANALEGRAIDFDAGTTAVLQKCLMDTAMRSKAHLNPKMKDFLKKIEMPDKESPPVTQARPTSNAELAVLRHLTTQRNYNPLNVPEELLKKPSGTTAAKRT
ncbi:hypothetical protein B5X24_HaOG215836 [Helicoverpa armigera]|nr:hypothetical protein B5X24_HaOG215836 [Helicoverpa armigera]